MKFSDTRQDTNYDELENSIVDSLSEISTASNLQLNPHSQELINRTINDVISSYLWSNDQFSSRHHHIDLTDSRKNKKYRKSESDYDRLIKHAWDSDLKTSSNKKEDKQNVSNKLTIPTLDFSSLSDTSNSKLNKFQDENNKSDDQSNKKDKNSTNKQKSYENTIFTIKTDPRLITNDSKSKSKNELQNHSVIKYEIENLLKELKLSKSSDSSYSEYYNQENETKLNKTEFEKLNQMALNLKDLLSRLLDKRKSAKRNISVEKMTREEIQVEKIDTQKELLAFEEKHGRPQTKLEKDLMRPLYDHYRKVKRILSKYTSGKGVGDMPSDENLAVEDEDLTNFKDHKHFINLHSLNLNELNKEKEISLQEKTKLREMIKKYENEFAKTNGRVLNKEDREYHKEDFEKYKILKAKIKLIEALIEKHEANKK